MKINNLENENRRILESKGVFSVMEYLQDISVSPVDAQKEYFASKMNIRRRQVVCNMDGETGVTVQSGGMQWMGGSVQAKTGVKGVGDLVGKMVKGAVTKEAAIKPEYVGKGILVLEPTYKHLIIENISEWGSGMTVEDGMFLACDSNVQQKVAARKSISSVVLGGEGLFNLALTGNGYAVLESNVPRNELIEIELENEELKIDGHMAICWSSTLSFTVERSTKTLIGSAVSGEGLVNVFRGTGKVLMTPVTQSETNPEAGLERLNAEDTGKEAKSKK